jgi:hypothetical protein
LWSEVGLGKKFESLSQNNLKMAEGLDQLVEHLPSKHEAQSSNPNTKKGREGDKLYFLQKNINTYLHTCA